MYSTSTSVYQRPHSCKPISNSQTRSCLTLETPEAVSRQMVPFHDSADVAILKGNNLPSAIRPREVIAGNDDEPYAQKSILGWGIVGVVGSSQKR